MTNEKSTLRYGQHHSVGLTPCDDRRRISQHNHKKKRIVEEENMTKTFRRGAKGEFIIATCLLIVGTCWLAGAYMLVHSIFCRIYNAVKAFRFSSYPTRASGCLEHSHAWNARAVPGLIVLWALHVTVVKHTTVKLPFHQTYHNVSMQRICVAHTKHFVQPHSS